MEFKEQQLKNILEINPRMTLKKGTVTKKIAMEHLTEYVKQVKGYELSEFKSGSKFKNKDTLVARITPCLENGKTAYVDILADDEVAFGSTEFFVVRAKENKGDPQFIYYLMRHPKVRDATIKSMTGTSGRQRAQKEAILEYSMSLPNIFDQKKIGYFLSLFDSKIEANNDTIHNLEQLSQNFFKHWFIDFEFPNEEGKPYKSSGGEMVESELGEIPKGWKVFPLYDLAEYINGTSFKKHELQNEKNDLPIIKIAELKSGFSGNTKYFIGEKDKKYYLKNGDILFSWSGNPETSIDTFFWTRGKGILNQHIFKVVSTKYPQQLIYILLKYFKPTFSRIASNKQTTGLGHVTVKDLKRLKVVLPLDSSPYVQLNHLGDLILNLNLENIKLQELRDTLLPKLLSGEIEIPDNLEV